MLIGTSSTVDGGYGACSKSNNASTVGHTCPGTTVVQHRPIQVTEHLFGTRQAMGHRLYLRRSALHRGQHLHRWRHRRRQYRPVEVAEHQQGAERAIWCGLLLQRDQRYADQPADVFVAGQQAAFRR